MKARAMAQVHKIGDGIQVRKSTIPDAGNGLFSDQVFEKGEFITWYDGVVEDVSYERRKELQKIEDLGVWSHIRGVTQTRVVHGYQNPEESEGGGSFMNDGFNAFQPANVDIMAIPSEHVPPQPGEYELYVRAKRRIEKGEELFYDYSSGYWDRFAREYPDVYERLFACQVTSKTTLRKMVEECDDGRLQPLLDTLQDTPVPYWPEFKLRYTKWTIELCRYALFKCGACGAGILTLGALRLLKTTTDAYFKALGCYVCFLTEQSAHALSKGGNARGCVSEWNRARRGRAGRRRQPVVIPSNGIFLGSGKSWSVGHIQVFYYCFRKDNFCTEGDRLIHVLQVLHPAHPFYEALCAQYIFRAMKTKEGEVLDFNCKDVIKNRKALGHALWSNGLYMPVASGTPKSEWEKWSLPGIRDFLRQNKVKVIDPDPARNSPWKKLENTLETGTEHEYTEVFLNECRSHKCQFASMARASKGSHCRCGIRFKPIAGLEYKAKDKNPEIAEKNFCDKHALFMQYVQRAGIDCYEVYEQITNETLYRCLDMMQQEYLATDAGKKMAQDFVAMAVCDCENKGSRKSIFTKYRKYLSADLRALTNQECYEALKPIGDELRETYKKLPRLREASFMKR